MNTVDKALWFIESHLAGELTLADIAAIGGVSRYHMTRAFGVVTGHSIMRYVRGRRLSEAARVLAQGAPDILAVALDAGYGSHEAFTRAFREQFGFTPETVRAQRHLSNIELVEPVKMTENLDINLPPPRFETGRLLLIAGLSARYTCESGSAIPAQWQSFQPYLGNIPGQLGGTAYGVCCNSDDAGNFDYICGVEVSDFSRLPPALSPLRVPEQRYAVFKHGGHISTIRSTWNAIWNQWFPQSGHEALDAPDFERYGEEFDPDSGDGGLEIWIPVQQQTTPAGSPSAR
jgi:AraC family transcriptional regulator